MTLIRKEISLKVARHIERLVLTEFDGNWDIVITIALYLAPRGDPFPGDPSPESSSENRIIIDNTTYLGIVIRRFTESIGEKILNNNFIAIKHIRLDSKYRLGEMTKREVILSGRLEEIILDTVEDWRIV